MSHRISLFNWSVTASHFSSDQSLLLGLMLYLTFQLMSHCCTSLFNWWVTAVPHFWILSQIHFLELRESFWTDFLNYEKVCELIIVSELIIELIIIGKVSDSTIKWFYSYLINRFTSITDWKRWTIKIIYRFTGITDWKWSTIKIINWFNSITTDWKGSTIIRIQVSLLLDSCFSLFQNFIDR